MNIDYTFDPDGRYKVTPKRPGIAHPSKYVKGSRVAAAIEAIEAKYGTDRHIAPKTYVVAERHEYFNNGCWHTSYRPVTIVVPERNQ